MLSGSARAYMASGELLFCPAAGRWNAEHRRKAARTWGSAVHLLSGKRPEATGGEHLHTVRPERSFTLLEDVDCPAVLAEQCFVTNAEDVERFGSEESCKAVARIYYEVICAYFGTEPLPTE